MGLTETQLDEQIVHSGKVSEAAWDHFYHARSEWAAAVCSHARLLLERLMIKYPTLISLDFEIRSEYDDEGHYPEYVSVQPAFSDGTEPEEDSEGWFDIQDEIRDTLGLSPELARHFAGAHDDADDFSLTIEALRAREF